ncbi:hypothetical protein ACYOEI_26580, partial [Singulisphaera rosea]
EAIAAVAVVTVLGCWSDNGLNLARVSGKVTVKGQPATKGTVFFMPDESKGTVGPAAVGSLTADGSFVMSTESAGDGALVGQHMVGITVLEPVSKSEAEEIDPTKDGAGFMKAKAQAAVRTARRTARANEPLFTDKGGKKYRYLVPVKLSRPQESGVSVQIVGSRTVNIDIDESGNAHISP